MIIKKSKAAVPVDTGMDTGEEAAAPAPEMQEESAQTAEIPASIIGGQAVEPGDKIQLTVVSVNAESGMITVTYDHSAEDKSPEGSDAMAADFGQPQPE